MTRGKLCNSAMAVCDLSYSVVGLGQCFISLTHTHQFIIKSVLNKINTTLLLRKHFYSVNTTF